MGGIATLDLFHDRRLEAIPAPVRRPDPSGSADGAAGSAPPAA
ncbi:Hypothetical protein A7982_00858 [Minicystis rosea]|nr:Hypothetical protein A7982_00858 [Minicystis rosea]